MLAAYDVAAWHATDAVQALHPPDGAVTRYIASKKDSGWEVAFGRLNTARDRFLIAYLATQAASPKEFTVQTFDPPREETGFYLVAAKGLDTVLSDFKGEKRSYNVSVLPTDSGQLYVYVLPAQTKNDVYLYGGDVRYLISADGTTIVEKRQMHKAILEFKQPADKNKKLVTGMHGHVLSNFPEDSDVFYVLTRRPLLPEVVVTPDRMMYTIAVDGTITPKKM